MGDAIKSGVIMIPRPQESGPGVMPLGAGEHRHFHLKDYLKLGIIGSQAGRKRIVDIVNRLSIR